MFALLLVATSACDSNKRDTKVKADNGVWTPEPKDSSAAPTENGSMVGDAGGDRGSEPADSTLASAPHSGESDSSSTARIETAELQVDIESAPADTS